VLVCEPKAAKRQQTWVFGTFTCEFTGADGLETARRHPCTYGLEHSISSRTAISLGLSPNRRLATNRHVGTLDFGVPSTGILYIEVVQLSDHVSALTVPNENAV